MRKPQEGYCRLCKRSSRVRRLTRHHVYPRRRRDRVPEWVLRAERNIILLCRPCHDEIELALHFRGDRACLSWLRRSMTVAEVEFQREHTGDWIDRHYPYWQHEGQRRLKRLLSASVRT